MRAESELCSWAAVRGGGAEMIACCLGGNKSPETEVVFLCRDQVGRGAEACGGEGLEEEGEVGWAGLSLAGGGCASASGCRLHLGHVCGKHCRCCSWVPLAARGCKWQGEMWDGAELGPAASVYVPREGSRRTERLWLAESQLGAGVHGEAGGDRRQSRAFPPSLRVLTYPRSDPSAWPRGLFHLWLAAVLIFSSSTLIPPCCALEALEEFRFTFFLFSILNTIVKFLKRGWACTCMQVCLEREATETKKRWWREAAQGLAWWSLTSNRGSCEAIKALWNHIANPNSTAFLFPSLPLYPWGP